MTDLLIVGRDPKPSALAAVDHKLNQALKKAAIVREHCIVDLEADKSGLMDLVEAHKPELIVALGNEASQALLGPELWPLDKRGKAEGSQKIRGYLWDTQYGRVLTTIHPAACLARRDPSGVWETYFKLDIKKAKQELDLGCPKLPERKVQVVSEPWEFQTARNAIAAAPRIAIDIENDGKLELSCLGIAVSRDVAFVIPARTAPQMDFIREVCEGEKPKVLQNGQYDRLFLTFDHQHLLHGERQAEPILVRNQTIDTMLQWHSLQPELSGSEDKSRHKKKGGYSRHTQKSLRFLASIFTREPFWKNYSFSEEMEKYVLCGIDCAVTLECAEVMEGMFK